MLLILTPFLLRQLPLVTSRRRSVPTIYRVVVAGGLPCFFFSFLVPEILKKTEKTVWQQPFLKDTPRGEMGGAGELGVLRLRPDDFTESTSQAS